MALGAAALVVLVVGGGALALGTFLSTSVEAAEVMPPDTEVFISIDFLQLIEGDARKLNDTIISMIEASGEVSVADMQDVEGFVSEIDAEMEEALGVDFTDDIRPWVGRTVSISLSDFDGVSLGDVPDILVVVETRDGEATDAFLVDLAAGIERATGVDVAQGAYNGVSLYIAADDFEFDPPLVFARIGSMVAFGTQNAVEAAIDADAGASLADNEAFAAVMDALPSDRIMSFYVDPGAFTEALETGSSIEDIGVDGVGASLSIADYGVRVDSVVLGEEPAAGLALTGGGVVGDLPKDTLFMFAGWSVASYWDLAVGAVGGSEIDDLLAEAEAELDIDIEGLLRALDAPSAVALVESKSGVMAQELGAPIGLLGLFGTTRPDEVDGYVEDLVDYMNRTGVEDLRRTVDSGRYWVASTGDEDLVAFGVTDDYLVAATSSDLAQSIGRSPTLSDNVELRAVSEAMGIDPESVLMFVDFAEIVRVFNAPSDLAEALSPLGSMAASYEVEDDRALGVFVWMIDYVESSE
jgi:hypothetical protein